MKASARTGLWTLGELSQRAEKALRVGYEGSPNGQVSLLPSPRTIRYYQTIGILDRPAEMRGRTALYGRRHLLQIVAIKRLQEEGLALVEIQKRLGGASARELTRIADLPEETPTDAPRAPAPEGRTRGFWSETPVESDQTPVESDQTPTEVAARGLLEIDLGGGVRLTLPGHMDPSDDDMAAIRGAGARLLEVLKERGLVKGDQ